MAELASISKARNEATRDEILQAAIATFRDEGYKGASMRKIADRLGVTAPGIYYYFKNKQDLLASCLEETLNDLLVDGRNAVAAHPDDPLAQLKAFVDAHINYQFESVSDELSKAYTGVHNMGSLTIAVSTEHTKRISEIEKSHLDTLRKILELGTSRGIFDIDELTPTAFAIFAIGEHLPFWFNPRGQLGLQGAIDHAVRLTLRMVGLK